MPLSLLLALFAQPQPAVAAPEPREANYVVHDAYPAPGGGGHIGRLLEIWSRGGAVRMRPNRISAGGIEECLPRERVGRIDGSCVRRRLPQIMAGEEGVPVIAIVARDSGRRHPVLNVACHGPAGTGSATVNVNSGGAFSPHAGMRNEARAEIARCIHTALRGAGPAFDEWNTGPEGHPIYFYHRIAGDCGGFRFMIGRNAVGGAWTLPLDAARTLRVPGSGGHPAAVTFQCANGAACITHLRGGQQRRLSAFTVPFGLESKAQTTLARLDRLGRVCRAGA